MKEYALYKGDNFIVLGTIPEIAKFIEIKVDSVKFMLTPTYKKRRMNGDNFLELIQIEDDDMTN